MPRRRWLTVVVAAGALITAVLLGGAGGLLLASSADDTGGAQAPDPVDIGFAQDMTVHHQQGVTLASWARDHSDDPAIQRLAGDVEIGQSDQIGRMQGWLGVWGQPASADGAPMAWMPGRDHQMNMAEGRMMPGMANNAEIDRLRALSGRDLDVYFLQLLIRHHQGGAAMMRAAIDGAAVGEVRNLAARMLDAQTAEIEAMTRMLTDRGAAPLPAPGG